MTGKPERLTSKYDKISYGDIEKNATKNILLCYMYQNKSGA